MKKTYVNKKGKIKTYTEKSFNDYYVIDLLDNPKYMTRFWRINYLKKHIPFSFKRFIKRQLRKCKTVRKGKPL